MFKWKKTVTVHAVLERSKELSGFCFFEVKMIVENLNSKHKEYRVL
jgi:hypothetical protein